MTPDFFPDSFPLPEVTFHVGTLDEVIARLEEADRAASLDVVSTSAGLASSSGESFRSFFIYARPAGGYRLSCVEASLEVLGGVFDSGSDLDDYADAYEEGCSWFFSGVPQ